MSSSRCNPHPRMIRYFDHRPPQAGGIRMKARQDRVDFFFRVGPARLEFLEQVPQHGQELLLLRRNLFVYGLGGIVAPFAGIKLIDLVIRALHFA